MGSLPLAPPEPFPGCHVNAVINYVVWGDMAYFTEHGAFEIHHVVNVSVACSFLRFHSKLSRTWCTSISVSIHQLKDTEMFPLGDYKKSYKHL